MKVKRHREIENAKEGEGCKERQIEERYRNKERVSEKSQVFISINGANNKWRKNRSAVIFSRCNKLSYRDIIYPLPNTSEITTISQHSHNFASNAHTLSQRYFTQMRGKDDLRGGGKLQRGECCLVGIENSVKRRGRKQERK